MPFVARCPYCRFGVKVPDRAMAASVKCPSCQSWYTATPDSDPTLGRPASAPQPAPLPVPVSAPTPAPPAAKLKLEPEPAGGTAVATAPKPKPKPAPAPAPTPGPVPVELTAPAEVEERTAEGYPHPLGIAACLVAGAALAASVLPATAFLTRPLAGVALLLGAGGWVAVASASPGRQILPALGAGVGALTLLVSLFAPSLLGLGFEARQQKSNYDPDAVRVVPLQMGAGSADNLETEGYADASRAAVQQGSFRVQVLSATVGPVQAVAAKQRFTKQPYLAVVVRVQHLGHAEDVRFTHWGAVGERVVPPAVARFGGKPLAAANTDPDVPLGAVYGHDLFRGTAVDDVLLFDPPAGTGPVRLDLPGEAWGAEKVAFKFHIPASMVTVQQPPKKPK